MKLISRVADRVFILCVAAVLTSCVSVKLGRSFRGAGVRQLEVGTTTKAQVVQLFGPPYTHINAVGYRLLRVHFGDDDAVLIWRYLYGSGYWPITASGRVLQVEFDAAGRLVDYYYDSRFAEDATPRPVKETNFDIFPARDRIVPGKSSRTEVAAVLGTNYAVLPFNKPGVAERWHYGYSETSKTEKSTFEGMKVNKVYSKSVNVDFDAQGIVQHLKGESDFPDDFARK